MTAREHTPALSAHALTCGYAGGFSVGPLDLELRAHEVVCLIGANGAGKSTVLRTLAQDLPALSGTVCLEGRDASRMSAAERARIRAVLFSERRVSELISCLDVVRLGRNPHTGPLGRLSDADHEAVERAMDIVGVTSLADAAFDRISDGQRQRVLLARAIAQEPRVLLLDEPCTYLDIRYRIELVRILRRLAREQGMAIACTMHELPLVPHVADRVICLKEGSVMCQGNAAEMLAPEVVDRLFDLVPGTYDALAGGYAPPAEDARTHGGHDHA